MQMGTGKSSYICVAIGTIEYTSTHSTTVLSATLLSKFPVTFVLHHNHPLNHPVRAQCIFLCKV